MASSLPRVAPLNPMPASTGDDGDAVMYAEVHGHPGQVALSATIRQFLWFTG